MAKYKNKKRIKSNGIFKSLFNLFSDMYGGEQIKKSFKSIALSFKGKSKKEIEEHFKMQEMIEDMRLKDQAKKEYQQEKNQRSM